MLRGDVRLEWPGKSGAQNEAVAVGSDEWVADAPSNSEEPSIDHRFYAGENLSALRRLARDPTVAGHVDVLYLDPPYGTRHDFVFDDRHAGPSPSRHNWLSFLYARLLAARSLLASDARVLASIDDREVHTFRLLLDEVFGADRFTGTLVWRSRRVVDSRNRSGLSNDHEYVLVYGGPLEGRPIDRDKYANPDDDPRGPWMSDNLVGLASAQKRPNLHYDLVDPATGINYGRPAKGWRYDPVTMGQKIRENRILWPSQPGGRPRHKRFLAEVRRERTGLSSLLDLGGSQGGALELRQLLGDAVFEFPKPLALMRLLLEQATKECSIVLDPFAGSGTTGQAVLELNAERGGERRFILVESTRPTGLDAYPTIADIGLARLGAVARRLAAGGVPARDLGFRTFRRVDRGRPPPLTTVMRRG